MDNSERECRKLQHQRNKEGEKNGTKKKSWAASKQVRKVKLKAPKNPNEFIAQNSNSTNRATTGQLNGTNSLFVFLFFHPPKVPSQPCDSLQRVTRRPVAIHPRTNYISPFQY